MDREAWPMITVIVPVRNEARCIERTLTKIAQFNYPRSRYEIIVADGQSEDDTAERVRRLQQRFPHIRLFENPKRWSSAARNIGVRNGRGEIFVVIDGHCDIDDPNYLRHVVRAFRETGADCLGRPQPLEIDQATPLQEAIALARRSWLGHNPASYIYSSEGRFVEASSVAVAYRREVFEKIGLFDETFDACEDVELNHRIDASGLRCWFAPELAVHYHPRQSIPALMKQMARYGRGRVRLAFKHPEALTFPAAAPLLFFLSCLGLLVAGLWWREAALLGAGLASSYAVVVLLASTGLARRAARLAARCWLPVVFVAVHLGFAWGTLREVLRQVRLAALSVWSRRPILRPVGEWLPDQGVDNNRPALPPAAVRPDSSGAVGRAAA